MCRKTPFVAVTVLFLLTPIRLYAGGPPRLTLPIAGVTPANARVTTEQLTKKLSSKVLPEADQFRGLGIYDHGEQPYIAFYFIDDVRLSDIQAALKGSEWSIPRDRTHLFGHVVLEIDPRSAPTKELLADLKAMEYVSVVESETKDGLLQVTVEMPYPVMESGKSHRDTVGWDKFERNEYSSVRPTKSEPQATAESLPTYNAFRNLVAKHKATLKDIRWSTEYACRAVGAVGVKEKAPAYSAASN